MIGHIRTSFVAFAVVPLIALALASGCAATPDPTGFLSDYSKLEEVKKGHLKYMGPDLGKYTAIIMDPIQVRTKRDPPVLKPEERVEVVHYLQEGLENQLRSHDYKLTDKSGVGVARFRIAITDLQKSKWYMNLYWATKVAGAGTGGASVEAELIDSITGEQLAAVVRADKGNQFELDQFASLDDIHDVLDKWIKAFGERLDEMVEEREE